MAYSLLNDIKITRTLRNKATQQAESKKKLFENKQWWTARAILGNTWAHFFLLIGARERGKSYSVQQYCLQQFFDEKSKLYHQPFYWIRLSDVAVQNMKMNNGAKMFEPILYRSYDLAGMKVKGDSVFVDDMLLCRLYGLSTAYNNKGSALFDANNFNGANIIVDEIALEKGQKRSFDVVYNLKMQIENICRSQSKNVRVFMILNNTEECPAVCSMFNFIPLEWGVYKLKRRKCLIDFIPNSEAYEKRREGALANMLDNGTGNFTNQVKRDMSLLYKGRLQKPQYIIKFTKDPEDWFTVWDGNIVCKWNKENKPSIAMRRYIDAEFLPEKMANIVEQNDVRAFRFRDLFIQTRFYTELQLVKNK